MEEAHRHWFEIEPPSGPTSKGVCKSCGETREFRNRLTEDEELQVACAKPPRGYVERLAYTNVAWR